MERLKLKFRDIGGLFARIDMYVARSSLLRVGIIPHSGRVQCKPLLEALVSDPIQHTAWNDAVARRPLTKDVLVTQSSSFEYTETRNSLVVYPVPFAGRAVELLEVSRSDESAAHLRGCHLLLDVFNNDAHTPSSAAAAAAAAPDDALAAYPRWTVIDTPDVPDNLSNAGASIRVSSSLALRANALLQESPANVSTYLDLRRQSRIDVLRAHIDDTAGIYTQLRDSIVRACEQQISARAAAAQPERAAAAAQARAEWVRSAHAELEGVLMPRLRSLLRRELAWYKLYARADDVAADVAGVAFFLPQAAARLEYLRGQQGCGQPPRADPRAVESAVARLQVRARRCVLEALGVQLPVALGAAFLHFGGGGVSAYAAGALAALGAVVGLRRMQAQWMGATAGFLAEVHAAHVAEIECRAQEMWHDGEKRELGIESDVRAMREALSTAALE